MRGSQPCPWHNIHQPSCDGCNPSAVITEDRMPGSSVFGDLNALQAMLRGDPRAAQAYEVGKAAASGWEDLPIPHDSVVEMVIDGEPVRVLLMEPVHDDG